MESAPLRLFEKRESFKPGDFNSPRHRNSKSLTTHAKLATFEQGEANPAYIITCTRRRYTLLEYQVSIDEFSSSGDSSDESGPEPEEKKNNEIMKPKKLDALDKKVSSKNIKSEKNSKKLRGSSNEMKKRTFLKKRTVKMHGSSNQEPLKLVELVTKLDNKCEDPDTMQLILNTLKGHFLFSNMDETQLNGIIKQMFSCVVEKDDYIFKQGDDATCFFVIESGQMAVLVNESIKRNITKGDSFGDLALLYNATRSASIRALEHTKLWAIDRQTFKIFVQETSMREYSTNRRFIDAVSFFDILTNEQKDAIAMELITEKFNLDQTIVNEGDQASCFYIIKEGSVKIFKGDNYVRTLYQGDSFGESALLYDTVRQMTVKAAEKEVVVFALSKQTISEILGDIVQRIAFRNLQKWAFKKSEILNQLTPIQRERVIDRMMIRVYKTGQVVLHKGALKKEKIVVVHEGVVQGKNSSTIYQKGTIFGDEYLLSEINEVYEDPYFMITNGIVSEISTSEIEVVLGSNFKDIIQKNEKSNQKTLDLLHRTKTKEVINVELDDLYFIRSLGFGHYGSVYLVQDEKTDKLFALKSIARAKINEYRIEKHLQQEKSVLNLVNFPFIVEFVTSFEDEHNLYFLLEYIKGMELFDVIRKIGILETYDSQFYIASIILAVEYLHAHNIVQRDIKPENIMIDDKGYSKMIDMGTCKFLTRNQETNIVRTFTIIGTPHYMAPEIVKSKGYGFSVDYWSIGICLYEFMCGMLPFGEETDDPYEIYEEILKKEIKYPSYLRDRKARRLMNQMLSKVPEVRLGGSFSSLKADPWFGDFDWEKLTDKELKPPYIPLDVVKEIDEAVAFAKTDPIPIQEHIYEEMLANAPRKFVMKD